MLPRRLFFPRSTNANLDPEGPGLLRQITMALLVVFGLALATAVTTEMISLITPTTGLAIVP